MLQTCICGIKLNSCIYISYDSSKKNENLELSKDKNICKTLEKQYSINNNDLEKKQCCRSFVDENSFSNDGIDLFINKDVISIFSSFDKPYFVSITELILDNNNMEMLNRIFEIPEITAIELNLSCSYDFIKLEIVLMTITSHPLFDLKPFGIKLAPYFDKYHCKLAIDIISKYPISFIVCSNTISNAIFIDINSESVLFDVNNGSGSHENYYCRNITLTNVKMMNELLHENGRDDIDIIGHGDINTGKDAFEMILCGASAIQIGNEKLSCFDKISKELCNIMLSKGYKTIDEFKGKIKNYSVCNIIDYEIQSKQSTISISKNNVNDITSYQIYIYSFILLLITIIMFLLEDKYKISEEI